MSATHSPWTSCGTAGVVSGLVRFGLLGPLTLMALMRSLPSQEGNSGDDWQWVDAAISMLPVCSFGAAGFVRRAGGVEHVVREEYFSASTFGN